MKVIAVSGNLPDDVLINMVINAVPPNLQHSILLRTTTDGIILEFIYKMAMAHEECMIYGRPKQIRENGFSQE